MRRSLRQKPHFFYLNKSAIQDPTRFQASQTPNPTGTNPNPSLHRKQTHIQAHLETHSPLLKPLPLHKRSVLKQSKHKAIESYHWDDQQQANPHGRNERHDTVTLLSTNATSYYCPGWTCSSLAPSNLLRISFDLTWQCDDQLVEADRSIQTCLTDPRKNDYCQFGVIMVRTSKATDAVRNRCNRGGGND